MSKEDINNLIDELEQEDKLTPILEAVLETARDIKRALYQEIPEQTNEIIDDLN